MARMCGKFIGPFVYHQTTEQTAKLLDDHTLPAPLGWRILPGGALRMDALIPATLVHVEPGTLMQASMVGTDRLRAMSSPKTC